MLEGVTVLDLASVGPAARTSRWLADYGARVIKVGPPPKQSGVQIVPPFYAYGGHRGMERVQLDLKADAGKAIFLRLAERADVVIESFRPGVVDRLGIGFDDVAAVNSGIVYCSTSGYGQTGPKAQWAGHDINYLAAGGYLDCSGRNSAGGPALPGATVADSSLTMSTPNEKPEPAPAPAPVAPPPPAYSAPVSTNTTPTADSNTLPATGSNAPATALLGLTLLAGGLLVARRTS
jgi:LPXTG-motif cell wall-anchored protein